MKTQKTFYGIYTKTGICVAVVHCAKIPLILQSKKLADKVARERTKSYKRAHTVKAVKI